MVGFGSVNLMNTALLLHEGVTAALERDRQKEREKWNKEYL